MAPNFKKDFFFKTLVFQGLVHENMRRGRVQATYSAYATLVVENNDTPIDNDAAVLRDAPIIPE